MNIFGSLWHEHIRFMSPLGCQYVMRTYWTDVSTPAVVVGIVWLYGPKIRATLRVRPVRVQRPTGKQQEERKQPAAGREAQFSTTTTMAFHSEPYQVEE
ncbi:hypothetical protein EVAR_76075_1 [Eumeta japonica]|uniref:Uncharacterized protein n=1 Tax=Eumeta variegata TaxID=151549 RepID=A0A4C1W4G5_EUMVA|nr:hypothetical protein EVAR_76075_1 [Eumeta japonica]